MTVTAAQKRRLFRDLEKVDPEFIEKIYPLLDLLYRFYFRVDITGWENVIDGKALYVGNHNGVITYEVVMLFHAWWKKYKGARRALGLAHGIALNNPFFRWLCPRIGAIPADPDVADEAFARGYSLLVYPGGEKEAMRSYFDRNKIDFFQRKGFIKLALRAKVPITPVVSIGAHETYFVLHRGEQFAKWLGLEKKYRLHAVPVTFRGIFLIWCLALGLVTFFPLLLVPAAFTSLFVPLPAKMSFRILPSIDVCAMYDDSKTPEENWQIIYDHVLGLIQKVFDEEMKKRKMPIVG